MSTIESVLEAKRHIQHCRKLGKWEKGEFFVSALSEDVRVHPLILIELTQLFLVQGHFVKAWNTCELMSSNIQPTICPDLELQSNLNEDSICSSLLSAYVSISRHGKLRSALALADRLHRYLDNERFRWDVMPMFCTLPAHASDGAEQPGPFCLPKASNQAGDDVRPSHCEHCRNVSEVRLLIEFYIWKIFVVAAEQGLLDEAGTKSNAVSRLDRLRLWAIEHDRLSEARYLTYFRIEQIEDSESDVECLQQLLEAIKGKPELKVEEAQTHLDFARCLLAVSNGSVTEDSKVHIGQAEELFKEVGHHYGQWDLMDMQLTSRKSNRQVPLDEYLKWKNTFADAYFKQKCYQQGIRCLIFGIPVSHELGSVQNQTTNMIERARSEIRHVGAIFQEQALFISAVAQTLVRAPEYGYGRRALEDYLTRLPEEMGPKIETQLYTSMSLANSNSGNSDKAALYAQYAMTSALQVGAYQERSDAAFLLAISRLKQAENQHHNKQLAFTRYGNASNILLQWCYIDIDLKCYSAAATKFAWLSWIELQVFMHFSEAVSLTRSDALLDEALRLCNTHKIMVDKVRELRILRANRLQDYDVAVELAEEQLNLEKRAATSTSFSIAQLTIQLSISLNNRFLCRWNSMIQLPLNERPAIVPELLKDWQASVIQAGAAYDLYLKAGGSEMLITSLNHLYITATQCDLATTDILKYWLQQADIVERFCDAIRRSVAMSADVQSLLEKRLIISGSQYRKFYDIAFNVCRKLDDATGAWNWVQKGKARSLSDVFGVRSVLPSSLMDAIRTDKTAHKLFEEERVLQNAVLESGPLEQLDLRRKGEQVRDRMLSHPLLSQVLDIREGTFDVSFSQVELDVALKLTSKQREAIKYVEWWIPSDPKPSTKIVTLVRSPDASPIVRELNFTYGDVRSWIRKRLQYPQGAKPPLGTTSTQQWLQLQRELVPLTQGLESLTQEEDLLVLSPSGLLNQIPFHALSVGGKIMIARNPVIYASSSASFRHTYMRATAYALQTSSQPGNASLFAVYQGINEEEQAEEKIIYEHVDHISKSLPFDVAKGEHVTKTNFMTRAGSSNWIHYHGHASFDKANVLKSCLVLAGGHEGTEGFANTAHESGSVVDGSRNLSVGDVFDLDMRFSAPHVTIVACDSGTQDITAGDEPLGFIPALLYAGATSVVGTLWPVHSRAGRTFSELFYKNIDAQFMVQKTTQVGTETTKIMDLAQALRSAVCEMMRPENVETKAPIHWAAFVLHGCWFRDHS